MEIKKKKDTPLKAVTDNWLLEFGFRAIETGLPLRSDAFMNSTIWPKESADYILALLQLLDLLVLNDELLHEQRYSGVWKNLKSAQRIANFLKPFSLNRIDKKKLVNEFKINPNDLKKEFEGTWFSSLWYLGFSKATGLNYWPSPKRNRFLNEHCFDLLTHHSIRTFKGWFDDNLNSIIKEALIKISHNLNPLSFPGFGYLAICESEKKEGILNAIIDIRNAGPTKAFRKWLKELEEAQRIGNIKDLLIKLREIEDVFDDVRQDLGFANKDLSTEIQLGLSAGIKFNFSNIHNVIKKLKPKPLHITFLRKNLQNYISKTDIVERLSRLFPEIKDPECVSILSLEL